VRADPLNEISEAGSELPLEELRQLARAIATEPDLEPTLQSIAERIRESTGAILVVIERHSAPDEADFPIAWAGSAADPGDEPDASRTVIALGRRTDRLGAVVLWRERHAAPVAADGLERLGELSGMAAVALRRIVLEDRLRRSREAHDAAIETKFRLINGIADELKNRLGAAAEYVQLLDTEGELTEAEARYIAGSRRSIDAAVHLLNELLQLARAETGRLAVHLEPVNIGAVFRGIVRDYQLMVGTLDVEFDLIVPPNLPIIETDVDQVRQILDNLLGNAVRYTPPGGRITATADIRPGRRKTDPSKYVCLSVSDTGPGIGDKEKVFEEVYRIEHRGGAPGFRLAISRRVARLLGGDLTVEAHLPAGTTFTLWLPGSTRLV